MLGAGTAEPGTHPKLMQSSGITCGCSKWGRETTGKSTVLYLGFWECEVFRKSQNALFGDYFFFNCLFCFGKCLLNDLEETCDLQMTATTWWAVGSFQIAQTALSLMEKKKPL